MSTANINSLVNGITYQDTSTDNPTAGSRVFTLTQVKDSGGIANGGVEATTLNIGSTVNVVPVNDAPTLTAITKAGTEDTDVTFTAADFTSAYTDPEGTALSSVTISTLPSTGTLKIIRCGCDRGTGN